MKTVIADKIASVAQHRPINRTLQVSSDIPCEEGVLIAARILNSKSTYNTLELTSGRMAKVNRGDGMLESSATKIHVKTSREKGFVRPAMDKDLKYSYSVQRLRRPPTTSKRAGKRKDAK